MAIDQSTPTTKQCNRCGETKPLSAFYAYDTKTMGPRPRPECIACTKAKVRAGYLKDPQQVYRRMRAWIEKNREYHRAKQHERYMATRPIRLAQAKAYRKANRPRINAWNNRWRAALRLEVLAHYGGGVARCVCCGETTPEFLSIDHVNGGGSEHRKTLRGAAIYRWLKRHGYPNGYQTLCHNCNQAKGFYGICPHERARQATTALAS